jgi:hypothetical protein
MDLFVDRRTKSKVRVRVVGNASLGWAEVAKRWGAELEAIVTEREPVVKHGVTQIVSLLTKLEPITLPQALSMEPTGRWHGLMLATIESPSDSAMIATLFQRWRPDLCILALPSSYSRSKVLQAIPILSPGYKKTLFKTRHIDFGGVTTTEWHVIHISCRDDLLTKPTVMKMKSYSRSLQTALDDTLGGASGCLFEPRGDLGPNLVGRVYTKSSGGTIEGRQPTCQVVYSAKGVGPDLSKITNVGDRHFWVKANSVMNQKDGVVSKERVQRALILIHLLS